MINVNKTSLLVAFKQKRNWDELRPSIKREIGTSSVLKCYNIHIYIYTYIYLFGFVSLLTTSLEGWPCFAL